MRPLSASALLPLIYCPQTVFHFTCAVAAALAVALGNGQKHTVKFALFKACPASLDYDGISVDFPSPSVCPREDDSSCRALHCALLCDKNAQCVAALALPGNKCVRANAKAFLGNWLPSNTCETYVDPDAVRKLQQSHLGKLNVTLWQSLKLLYNFRQGLFNLAPIATGGHPSAPVARGVVYNQSLGVFFSGRSESAIDIATPADTGQLFLPYTSATIFVRGLFYSNFDNSTGQTSLFSFSKCSDSNATGEAFTVARDGSLNRNWLSLYSKNLINFNATMNAFLNTTEAALLGYWAEGTNRTTTFFYNSKIKASLLYSTLLGQDQSAVSGLNSVENYGCLRLGGNRANQVSSGQGWMHCFVLASKLSIADMLDISSWCQSG